MHSGRALSALGSVETGAVTSASAKTCLPSEGVGCRAYAGLDFFAMIKIVKMLH